MLPMLEEPPCLEPMSRRGGPRGERQDRIGCELGPLAKERSIRDAIDRGRDQG